MKKLHISRKKILISLLAVVVATGVALFYFRYIRADSITNPPPGQLDESGINYGPPTNEEKQQTDENKENVIERLIVEDSNQSTPNDKKSVTPVITYASQFGDEIRVNAYVSEIFEDGGKCIFTITQGIHKLTKTTDGFANVKTTDCTRMTAPRSEFPSSGDWQVTVTYSSDAAQGTSGKAELRIN